MSKEITIAKVNDLQDGKMKEVEVEGLKILLTRLDGTFYAIGGECSHYGGPLAEGVLSGMHVTCPWHQARFDVKTGGVIIPGLDSMARRRPKCRETGLFWSCWKKPPEP
jgi:nitrite reductase/ring-hydroxylating ferredoxin subunit